MKRLGSSLKVDRDATFTAQHPKRMKLKYTPILGLFSKVLLSSLVITSVEAEIQVFFHREGIARHITKAIRKVGSSIFVQEYSFTRPPIAKELVVAYKRGVKVFVILDTSQRTETYSSAT